MVAQEIGYFGLFFGGRFAGELEADEGPEAFFGGVHMG
jgi:hypothetical protein